MLDTYDSGDHLHPNADGYRHMGEIVAKELHQRTHADYPIDFPSYVTPPGPFPTALQRRSLL